MDAELARLRLAEQKTERDNKLEKILQKFKECPEEVDNIFTFLFKERPQKGGGPGQIHSEPRSIQIWPDPFGRGGDHATIPIHARLTSGRKIYSVYINP